ncbi:Ras guanyl-releasing protein 3 [Trichoplax sp. H2]|nr:Ras guanyl-releasing protein 3 [Trichoplax sp. H2]|eukprot:RDD42175.1 Ras guanyl-releasing protein 3 [Trichoplax sp. H2]
MSVGQRKDSKVHVYISNVDKQDATLEELLAMCLNSFDNSFNSFPPYSTFITLFGFELQDENGIRNENDHFLQAFFVCHPWFINSQDLCDNLLEIFHSDILPDDISRAFQNISTQDCLATDWKIVVAQVFRYWIENLPHQFRHDDILEAAIINIHNDLMTAGDKILAQLFDPSPISAYQSIASGAVYTTDDFFQCNGEMGNFSLDFATMTAESIANHLTYIESTTFADVEIQEIRQFAKKGKVTETTPQLGSSIGIFNGVVAWIQGMVLSGITAEDRAKIVTKFIEVGKYLKAINNFETLMAVVTGLSHTSLARLNQTFALLSNESKMALAGMIDLLTVTDNASRYPIHLKDLVSLDAVMPDYTRDQKINYQKLLQLSCILSELTNGQKYFPDIKVNAETIDMMKLSLEPRFSENEIYELSLAREPRAPKAAGSIKKTNENVFGAWASTITSNISPDIVKKHIQAMVKAVFKCYDRNKDGVLSMEEFAAIASNFPFLDAFGVIDTDDDGHITKEELLTYFERANFQALRQGFVHEFQETTYLSLTTCYHCARLLWGVIKQGYKCKGCGINCHKQCKDLVVAECRPRNNRDNNDQMPTRTHSLIKKKVKKDQKRHTMAALPGVRDCEQFRKSASMTIQNPDDDERHRSRTMPGRFINDLIQRKNSSEKLLPAQEKFGSNTSISSRNGRASIAVTEEMYNQLWEEKTQLEEECLEAKATIKALHEQLDNVRRITCMYLLEQMNQINLQRDSSI